MRISVLIWALIATFTGTTGSFSAQFRAGAATANITPPLGIEINGGTAPAIATHVHDELHARALVLDDGATRLAFVVVDNCLIDRALFDEAKAHIIRHTSIASNHVSISTTHTHSAGSVTGVHLSEPDQAYRSGLPRRIADGGARRIHDVCLCWQRSLLGAARPRGPHGPRARASQPVHRPH